MKINKANREELVSFCSTIRVGDLLKATRKNGTYYYIVIQAGGSWKRLVKLTDYKVSNNMLLESLKRLLLDESTEIELICTDFKQVLVGI